MTREEAIAKIGEQYKICQKFYNLSANPQKDYPDVTAYMEALDMALSALRPVSRGQYPHSVGSWTNSYGISETAHSVGERLMLDGVHTAYIGKWHLDGGDYFGLGKCPKGWDPAYWYDMKCYLEELTEQERYDSRHSQLMETRGGIYQGGPCQLCHQRRPGIPALSGGAADPPAARGSGHSSFRYDFTCKLRIPVVLFCNKSVLPEQWRFHIK